MVSALAIGAAAAAGAVKGASGKKTKTKSSYEPWSPTIGPLKDIIDQAGKNFTANPSFQYGPSQVPAPSSQTTSAQNRITNLASNPTGLIPAAQNQVKSTITGDYLNDAPGNPFLTNIASGQTTNPAMSTVQGLQGGYTDPSTAFNSGLMTGGYNDPSSGLYGQMAGAQAGDNTSGLFGQAAGMQAQSPGVPYFQQAGGMTAGQGGTGLYNDLAGMTGNSDALGMFGQLGGLQANTSTSGLYDQIGGLRADTGGMDDFAALGSMRANPNAAATGVYSGLAGGNFNQGANTFEQLANRQYTDPSSAAMADYLTPFANGSLSDVNSNPYLSGMLDIQSKKISDSIGSIFGAGGRYGSEAHQGTLGEQVGNAATSLLGQTYETNMGRQLSASNSLAGIGENRASRDLSAMSTGAAGMEGQRQANLGYNMAGANALTQQSQFGDQFGFGAAQAGAQGQQGIRQFSDQFAAQNLGAQAAGQTGLNNFADQFAAGNLGQAAAGTAGTNQFLDQFRAGNVGQAAAGIQNQDQFQDQFNNGALMNAGSALQGAGQASDAFNLQALLSGAQGMQGNQQFADQFGLAALGQGAAGLSGNALNQVQARVGGANALQSGAANQYNSSLSAAQLYGGLGQSNISNIASAAGGLNDAFSQERQNQLNATNNAPALDQARYLDAQQLAAVGMQKDAYNAAKAAEDNAIFQFNQNYGPSAALNTYLQQIGSIAGLGGQGTSITKQGGGTMAGIAGGLGGASSAMGMMGGGGGSMPFGGGGGGMSSFGFPSNQQMPFSFGGYSSPQMTPYGGNSFNLR